MRRRERKSSRFSGHPERAPRPHTVLCMLLFWRLAGIVQAFKVLPDYKPKKTTEAKADIVARALSDFAKDATTAERADPADVSTTAKSVIELCEGGEHTYNLLIVRVSVRMCISVLISMSVSRSVSMSISIQNYEKMGSTP